MALYNTNLIANINGVDEDLGNIFYNWSSNTININSKDYTGQRYSITYKKPTIILESDITVSMSGQPNMGDQEITFGPQVPGKFVLSGVGGIGIINDDMDYHSLGTTNVGSNTATGIFWDGIKWFGNTSAPDSSANIISYDGNYWEKTGTTNTSSGGWTWKAYYNGKIYLLINGNKANSAAVSYSYDGINWIAVSSLPISAYAIGWNGRVWLVGGRTNTTIYYSYNGISWVTTGQTPFSTAVYDLVWTGNIWVAVGNNGSTNAIFYNTDPIGTSSWIRANNSGTATTYSLCWNNKIMVSINNNNQILYSYDGINWSNTSYFFRSSNESSPIKWNGRVFVAGASSNGIAYSYNGINWIPITNNLTQSMDIEYNHRRLHSIRLNTKIVLGISGSGFAISYDDGITLLPHAAYFYTGRTFPSGTSALNYNGKLWITEGYTHNSRLFYSYDTVVWYDVVDTVEATEGYTSPTWNGKMWVSGGYNSNIGFKDSIIYSYDGITWMYSSFKNLLGTYVSKVVWTGKIWIALKGFSSQPESNIYNIAYSNDGINWTGSTISVARIITDITTNGNIYVINSGPSGPFRMWYSYDLTNWTVITGMPNVFTFARIECNNRMFVANFGYEDAFYYSYNGINWFKGTFIPDQESVVKQSIFWTGSLWISSAYYSVNGINWFRQNNLYSSIVKSSINYDPIPYIQHPTIAFGEGSSTIAYSPDGIVWKPLGNTVFTSSGRKGFWNGKMWVGVGMGGNTIAYSLDGYNWIGLGSSVFSNAGYDVTFNGSIWVAVGSGGNTIAYSTNGTQWSGVTNSSNIFSIKGTGVSWNGTIFLAIGIGTNAAATSANGITWSGVSSLTAYAAEGGNNLSCVANNGNIFWALGINAKFSTNTDIIYTLDYSAQTGWTTLSNVNGGGGPIIMNGTSNNATSITGSITGLSTIHRYSAEQQAMSETGQYIVIAANDTFTSSVSSQGKVFYSVNYGRNFNETTFTSLSSVLKPKAPAMSSDGKYVVVFNIATLTPTVWVSTNYGTSFSQINNNFSQISGNNPIDLSNSAISDDGNTIYMTTTQGVYRTTQANLGMSATWSQLNPSGTSSGTSAQMYRISCSSDGSIVLVGGRTNLYKSTNYGNSWSTLLQNLSGVNYVSAVAMTRDANKMIVAIDSSSVLISTNSGNTFIRPSTLPTTGNWSVSAISSDGSHMAIGNRTGLIYWSTNNGSTWSNFDSTTTRSISSVCIQEDILLFTTFSTTTANNNVYIARYKSISSILYGGYCWLASSTTGEYVVMNAERLNTWQRTYKTNTIFPHGVNHLCWNGKRFVGIGGNYIGYSTNVMSNQNGNRQDSWNSTLHNNIFSSRGYSVVSNPGIGAFIAPSALVIDNNGISGNGISNSRTLEFVSSDPYFQSGLDNITIKVEPKNII